MARIPDKLAADLLCNAFEGGSNYWCCVHDYKTPAKVPTPWGEYEYTPKYISYGFSSDGGVYVGDIENDDAEPVLLNRAAIARGKRIMETDDKYTWHFVDAITENHDAITGDVFLQLCLFGEVIYG